MKKRTLIIGNGQSAVYIAENLIANGINVILSSRDELSDFSLSHHFENGKTPSAEILLNTELISCDGTVGNYEIVLNTNGEKIARTASSIIIAEENICQPNLLLYNLNPSPVVLTLQECMDTLEAQTDIEKIFSSDKKAVFLSGLRKESHPFVMENIMQTSLALQSEFGIQTYILTGNLKVAGNGLELLYQKSKESGTVYLKFKDSMPEIEQNENGAVSISYIDEITGQSFTLMPAITIVDQTIFPSDYHAVLTDVLRLDSDQEGFLQTENVHRFNVLSNRKGIFVAGPSRMVQSPSDQRLDAINAVIANIQLLNSDFPDPEDRAEVKPGACVRCLTCFRLCPYRAIVIDRLPQVVPEACEGCGICLAECPKHAINIRDVGQSVVSESIQKYSQQYQTEQSAPHIVAFCCKRSAKQAMELARSMGYVPPQNFLVIEVPCAGSIAIESVLTAYREGADGVLILSCHEGNCHAEYGNSYAQRRVERIKDILQEMGFEKERLDVRTLASNMGKEFEKIVSEFEKKIWNQPTY